MTRKNENCSIHLNKWIVKPLTSYYCEFCSVLYSVDHTTFSCCNYKVVSMQTVSVLLGAWLKGTSGTKGRRTGQLPPSFWKKKKKVGYEGMFTISFGIMLNAHLSYGSCMCIFAYSVYSCFLFFATKIVCLSCSSSQSVLCLWGFQIQHISLKLLLKTWCHGNMSSPESQYIFLYYGIRKWMNLCCALGYILSHHFL